MTLLGLLALALGCADLAAGGLAGWPESRLRAALGLATGLVALSLGGSLLGIASGRLLVPLLLALATIAPWLFVRVGTPTRGRAMLAGASLLLGTLIALAIGWSAAPGPAALAWQQALPLPVLRDTGLPALVLGAGMATSLLATANGLVRSVLTVARTELVRSEARLHGGRYIGALERLLIFALAVAGEPTAAALVVSAKSLLRFPEVSGASRSGRPEGEVDALTEYFLLGSLVSWATALLPAALLAPP